MARGQPKLKLAHAPKLKKPKPLLVLDKYAVLHPERQFLTNLKNYYTQFGRLSEHF